MRLQRYLFSWGQVSLAWDAGKHERMPSSFPPKCPREEDAARLRTLNAAYNNPRFEHSGTRSTRK